MDVNKCPSCGKDLPLESKFCPYCMERLKEPEVVFIPEKKRDKKIIVIIVLAFIIILTTLLVVFVGFKNDDLTNNDISTEDINTVNDVDIKESDTIDKYDDSVTTGDNTESDNQITDDFVVDDEIKTTSSNVSSTTTTNSTNKVTTTQCVHNWIKQTKIVHHEEEGHYETVQKQRQVTQYKCPVCYKKFASLSEYYSHFDNTHKPSYSGDPISMLRNQYTTETGYEYYNVQEWVVDKKAYDETVVTGYKCKICGEEKSS